MNSKQEDNEDVSEDTTFIILITGRLDWVKCQQSQHQFPAWTENISHSISWRKISHACILIEHLFRVQ